MESPGECIMRFTMAGAEKRNEIFSPTFSLCNKYKQERIFKLKFFSGCESAFAKADLKWNLNNLKMNIYERSSFCHNSKVI